MSSNFHTQSSKLNYIVLESWLDFLIISRLVNFGKNGIIRRVHGEAMGQVIPGEQWKGPTHIHNIAEFPRERLFFLLLLKQGVEDPEFSVSRVPRPVPLKSRKETGLFLILVGDLGRNSFCFFPSLSRVFVERAIYKITNSQIPIVEKDFDMQTPYLQDRSNAFLITDSPQREIFDLQKSLIWTFDFMVECSWCEWEVSSLLPLIVFSVYKDFLEVYDVTFNPSYKYTTLRS